MFQSNLLNIHYYFCVQGFCDTSETIRKN
jgi:hypothetical protein